MCAGSRSFLVLHPKPLALEITGGDRRHPVTILPLAAAYDGNAVPYISRYF